VTIGVQEKPIPMIKLMMCSCMRKLGVHTLSLWPSFLGDHWCSRKTYSYDQIDDVFLHEKIGCVHTKSSTFFSCLLTMLTQCLFYFLVLFPVAGQMQSLTSPLVSTCHILGHGCSSMWWFMSKDCSKSFQWTSYLHNVWALFWPLDHTCRGKWRWTRK
jgi:hypothetical protein